MIKLDSLQERINNDGKTQYFYIARQQDDRTGEPVYNVYTAETLDYPNGIYLNFDGKKDYNAGGELFGSYPTQGEATKAITAFGQKKIRLFQLTRPLRGATFTTQTRNPRPVNFNSHAPCGARPLCKITEQMNSKKAATV